MRPSGEHYILTGLIGGQLVEVTIAQVAAALRAFTVDGVDIIQRYPDDAVPSLGAGIVMVPWPNRVDHGRWVNNGTVEQLDISQVAQDHALHGLLRSTAYTVVHRTAASITLSATIYAPNGYPFVVETFVTYTIENDGLHVGHRLHNHSSNPAPVAVGSHAYYKIGGVPTDQLTVRSTARTVYVDDERQVPVGRRPVEGQFDLRQGRQVGTLTLDHCFTDLVFENGEQTTSLTAPDGRRIDISTDENFAYQVVLTTSEFIGEDGILVRAVAIEPQTAAVNAFNNKDGLHMTPPHSDWEVSWSVRPVLARDNSIR